jgi:Holliday junction resolvase RusA-like endonuclease
VGEAALDVAPDRNAVSTLSDAPLRFVVYGRAQPAGSKRAMPVFKGGVRTGKFNVIDASEGAGAWKQEVAAIAMHAMAARKSPALTGALMLEVMFYFKRPKSHFRTGRNADRLRPGAPRYPSVKPDCTKLVRGVEDALTGIVWRDDAQVVQQVAGKFFGEPPRAEIVVRLPK